MEPSVNFGVIVRHGSTRSPPTKGIDMTETDQERAERYERERKESNERYERERKESAERHERERKAARQRRAEERERRERDSP